MEQHVVTSLDDGVFRIQLDRDDKRNTVGLLMAEGLLKACEQVASDPTIHCVVVSGRGRAFCGGADLSVSKEKPAEEWLRITSSVIQTLLQMPCPVITAVHGYALGLGAGLAMTGDFVIAEEDATIGFPEVHHGLVPGVIATILQNIVPQTAMRDLLFLGDKLTAHEANAMGLVYQVAPTGGLDAAVNALAAKLKKSSPTALRMTKKLFRDLRFLNPDEAIRAGEAAVLAGRTTEDAKEGMAAFKEKRRPQWTGR